MKKPLLVLVRSLVLLAVVAMFHHTVQAQSRTATVKVNKDQKYQKITGFGGFVNSPQFGYNHMTEAEIRKMWGAGSEAGYNIMRIYIPIGKDNWGQALATAQLAQSLNIKIFASPWSMPAEWKTYNTIASRYQDANGAWQPVYLKPEHYADYANYLNDFVTYLRENGVELEAIALQNEPDYQVDYAGCIWTPDQMTTFLKNHRNVIKCKVLAPETVGITNNYASAFANAEVLPHFDIFAGHQYGGIQSGLLNVQAQGKEVWMTEYLINWNTNGVSRDFNWSIDGFSFANDLNQALLSNVNAWIHYATKRYYGPLGDGIFGTTTGVMTKRGNILSHYAKYVTGYTRIQNSWNDNTNELRGSSYLSETGDKIVVQVINPSSNTYNLSVDLPFLSNEGKAISTTQTESMVESNVDFTQETNRPKVTVKASSVTTLVFSKSGDFEPSQMTSELINYEKLDNKTPTSSAFGTGYKLSGKTFTFLNSSPLFSTNTNANNGYLPLGGKFNRLVFQVESLSSSFNYSSSNTTLYYVNKQGAVNSKNYGSIVFDKRNDFNWVLNISEDVLTDGCMGIIGITSGNATSRLTFKFKDVYVALGTERGYKFSGVYSAADSYLMDCLEDITYTSLDFTNVTNIPAQTDWHALAANKNSLFYVQTSTVSDKTNVVNGQSCTKLELSEGRGDYYAPQGFTAISATYQGTLNGVKMLVLPFEADIPNGVKAYTLEYTDSKVVGRAITTGKIPANTPVLVSGSGAIVFEGSGAIASSKQQAVNPSPNKKEDQLALAVQAGISTGVYVGIPIPLGSYYLTNTNGVAAFSRVTSGAQPSAAAFNGYLSPGLPTTAASLELELIDQPLPVSLGRFTAKAVENGIQLDWTTYAEKNNFGFEVLRSEDGKTFEKIGFVAGNGTSVRELNYRLVDPSLLAGTRYYRLKQIDLDGAYQYSVIRSVQQATLTSVKVYPNPVKDFLTIDFNGNKVTGQLVIIDAVGRTVLQSSLDQTDQKIINVSNLAPGMYHYQANHLKGKFIK
ncbi:secretion protein [Siphonobacter sp. BAB-5405]|uniref:T9SS type A sorting domain-containing protein n=1 Tax=Siphonobacter sp. BAB-5405 TaxID=1864825 RepID=UPI000C805514|nr:T9SS type A sorting domain-containing protein [Siphonobacter sp. BAB-5405]PMD90391.1 secretion protein [Siphonobacter sp. BAB-5405]